MKKTLSLAVIALFAASAARAGEEKVRYQPEPDFEMVVSKTLASFEAKDAFLGVAECAVVDAKPIRPFTLPEAQEMLEPCMEKISGNYGARVTVKAGVVEAGEGDRGPILGLILWTSKGVTLENPMLRDLNYAIHARYDILLGHPAVVRREGEQDLAARSAAQDSVDRCLLPMVVRKIESGADFVRYYGRCISQDKSLKVMDIRPSLGHKLAVTVLSAADRPTVESLNGIVTVNAEDGPVSVLVLAYPETVFVP